MLDLFFYVSLPWTFCSKLLGVFFPTESSVSVLNFPRQKWMRIKMFENHKKLMIEIIIIIMIHGWVFPKIGGKPPKWMVYNGKPYEQMDDLGGKNPLFLETPT